MTTSKLRPLYCAQDLRDYIGYTITRVSSDDNDLNSRIYLENASGHTVVLHADKALDGESLFYLLKNRKEGQAYEQ